MKLIPYFLLATVAFAQFFPSPGPGKAPFGGGGGGGPGQVPVFKAYNFGSASASLNTIASGTINVAAGDLIVACIGRGIFGLTVTGFTDGGTNNTGWTKVGATSSSGAGQTVGDVDMWVKTNATANAGAVIAATLSSASTFRNIQVATYGNMATTSGALIDQSSCSIAGCAQTTSTAVTAVNVTTTQANELLVYCGYNNLAAGWTAANSFNLRSGTANVDAQLADRIVATTGTYPSGNIALLDSNVGQVGVFGTFKSAP